MKFYDRTGKLHDHASIANLANIADVITSKLNRATDAINTINAKMDAPIDEDISGSNNYDKDSALHHKELRINLDTDNNVIQLISKEDDSVVSSVTVDSLFEMAEQYKDRLSNIAEVAEGLGQIDDQDISRLVDRIISSNNSTINFTGEYIYEIKDDVMKVVDNSLSCASAVIANGCCAAQDDESKKRFFKELLSKLSEKLLVAIAKAHHDTEQE